jgi:hypothetical protein
MSTKETLRQILMEGQFVWYTRDELKKLSGYTQPNVNDALNEMIRMKMIEVKGGHGANSPRKYALKSRINGEVIEGSKVVSRKPLVGYEKWIRARMDLCNSTRRS